MKDRKEQRRKRRNLAAAHSQNKPKVHRPKTVYKRNKRVQTEGLD